jgi:hypothetical protein
MIKLLDFSPKVLSCISLFCSMDTKSSIDKSSLSLRYLMQLPNAIVFKWTRLFSAFLYNGDIKSSAETKDDSGGNLSIDSESSQMSRRYLVIIELYNRCQA